MMTSPVSSTCSLFYGTFQCCGSGSGIGCFFDPWIQDPGSGMGESQHPDPGSGMNNPDHIF